MKGKLVLQGNVKTFRDRSGNTLTIYSSEVEKVLVNAVCSRCKKPGMAYEDPNSIIQKEHICSDCLGGKK